MWQKKHLQYKQLCGCIVIGTWFFFVPACFHDSLTSALRMFIKVPYPFLKGIVDVSVLIGVCLLCGYPFLADKITKAGIRKYKGEVYFLAFCYCAHCPLSHIHGYIRKQCHSCSL